MAKRVRARLIASKQTADTTNDADAQPLRAAVINHYRNITRACCIALVAPELYSSRIIWSY